MTDVASTRTFQGVAIPAPGVFTLDPAHIRVGFVARHLMVSKVRGSFTKVTGKVIISEDPTQSSAEVTIDAATIDTGVAQRDGHLRSGDFLEAETYPTLDFRSTDLVPKGGNEFTLRGELTIKGVTHPVDLDVEFEGVARSPYGHEVIGFSAITEIDREAWGMTWNQALETGGVLVGRRVKIEIEGEAVRQ
jgi:polyisoprenoid-binding protein YceI